VRQKAVKKPGQARPRGIGSFPETWLKRQSYFWALVPRRTGDRDGDRIGRRVRASSVSIIDRGTPQNGRRTAPGNCISRDVLFDELRDSNGP